MAGAGREIGDRLDGKPLATQDLALTHSYVAPLPELTADEWLKTVGRDRETENNNGCYLPASQPLR